MSKSPDHPKNRNLIFAATGVVAIGALALVGVKGSAAPKSAASTAAMTESTPAGTSIADLVPQAPTKKHPALENEYKVEVTGTNSKGTVYEAVTAFADAEGLSMSDPSVYNGVANDSNFIQAQLGGDVNPDTPFYITASQSIKTPDDLQYVHGTKTPLPGISIEKL